MYASLERGRGRPPGEERKVTPSPPPAAVVPAVPPISDLLWALWGGGRTLTTW